MVGCGRWGLGGWGGVGDGARGLAGSGPQWTIWSNDALALPGPGRPRLPMAGLLAGRGRATPPMNGYGWPWMVFWLVMATVQPTRSFSYANSFSYQFQLDFSMPSSRNPWFWESGHTPRGSLKIITFSISPGVFFANINFLNAFQSKSRFQGHSWQIIRIVAS